MSPNSKCDGAAGSACVEVEVHRLEHPTEQHALLQLRSPEIVATAQPGQFVHLRASEAFDPLLRRPFSIMKLIGEDLFEVLVQVVGRGSRLLAEAVPGQRFSALGPLGKPFPLPEPEQRAILVAGGVGVAPLVFLADHLAQVGGEREIWGLYGAQTEGALCCWLELASRCQEFYAVTEDGSGGEQGLVTEVLEGHLAGATGANVIYACGPHAMLAAVARLARQHGIPAHVSLERWMGCGVGACLGCVVPSAREDTPQWVRVCADGPVFAAEDVDWAAMGT